MDHVRVAFSHPALAPLPVLFVRAAAGAPDPDEPGPGPAPTDPLPGSPLPGEPGPGDPAPHPQPHPVPGGPVPRSRGLAKLALGLGIGLAACATTSGAKTDAAALTDAKLAERNKALEDLASEALKSCGAQGKPEDNGVLVVTAKPGGELALGQAQWRGGEPMKKCLGEAVQKLRLPAWPGPSVSWLWSVASASAPAPGPADEPPGFKPKLEEFIRQAQGNSGMGNDSSTGPLFACAQRSLPPDTYARVMVRAFVFPDGKVAGATPVGADGERDAAYMDCVVEHVRSWQFSPLAGPGFFVLDVPLRYGVSPLDR